MRLSLLLAAALLAPAAAAQITVTTLDDELNADGDCSLREAIEAVNTGVSVDACSVDLGRDAIVFDAGLDGATLPLSLGELVVSSDLRIGTYDGPRVTLVAAENARLLRITAGSVFLDRLDLRFGKADRGGAVLVEAGATRLSIRNARVSNNEATGTGGGAVWVEGGAFSAAYTTFAENWTSGEAGQGGAVTLAGGEMSFGGETIMTLNSATDGGAVAVLAGNANLGFVDLTENTATDRGGALFVSRSSAASAVAEMMVTRFGANSAQNGGAVWAAGGLINSIPSIATVRDSEGEFRSVFEGNASQEDGGAIYLAQAPLSSGLEGVHLLENVAGGRGGGLYMEDGSGALLAMSVVSGNRAGALDTEQRARRRDRRGGR